MTTLIFQRIILTKTFLMNLFTATFVKKLAWQHFLKRTFLTTLWGELFWRQQFGWEPFWWKLFWWFCWRKLFWWFFWQNHFLITFMWELFWKQLFGHFFTWKLFWQEYFWVNLIITSINGIKINQNHLKFPQCLIRNYSLLIYNGTLSNNRSK